MTDRWASAAIDVPPRRGRKGISHCHSMRHGSKHHLCAEVTLATKHYFSLNGHSLNIIIIKRQEPPLSLGDILWLCGPQARMPQG